MATIGYSMYTEQLDMVVKANESTVFLESARWKVDVQQMITLTASVKRSPCNLREKVKVCEKWVTVGGRPLSGAWSGLSTVRSGGKGGVGGGHGRVDR